MIANNLLFLALRNSGVVGVGQTPFAEDLNDALVIMNAMIGNWNLERKVQANPIVLPAFPDQFTDVPFWDPYAHVLLTTMSVRLRQVYALPPVDVDVTMAANALQLLQALNAQQIAPLDGGVPASPLQLIYLALRMAGRINDKQLVTRTSKDVDDAFSMLVGMMSQWQRKRWLTFVEQTVGVASSTGSDTYTIGPTGQFACARPDHITSAYIRILGGSPPNLVDIPVDVIESAEDFAQISIKTLQTMPMAVFYESAFPMGILHWWPVPPAAMYGLYVVCKVPLPVYATLDDPLNLPPEYQDALVSNLACRIAAASGTSPTPYVLAQSVMSLNTLRQANVQLATLAIPVPLGRIRSDISLVGKGLGRAFILDAGAVL